MMFSIVIAAYNVEPYIADCIDSLKRQTFTDFEALVVDDASTDATLEIARRHAGDDARFRFFRQSANAGQSAARNEGLSHSMGDFVLFLDSDDYYLDETLQTIADYINKNQLDQLYFAAKTFCENRRLRRERYEDQENRAPIEGVMTGPELYVALESTGSFRPSACLFALRRSLIEEHSLRFPEGIIHEDLLFLMLAMPLPKRAAFLMKPLYMRRMREGSTMTVAYSIRNVAGLFHVAQVMRRWIFEHAQEHSQEFCDAYAKRVFDTYNIPARYLFDIPEKDVQDFRETLCVQDRIDFDVHILEHYRCIKAVYDEMTSSRTYRIGRVFMAVPSWIKGKIAMPK